MKLNLSANEVLALYRFLLLQGSDSKCLLTIKDKIEDHIFECIDDPFTEEQKPRNVVDEMFSKWENSVSEKLSKKEKDREKDTENIKIDVLEDYDSSYPKSFKRSRNRHKRKKK